MKMNPRSVISLLLVLLCIHAYECALTCQEAHCGGPCCQLVTEALCYDPALYACNPTQLCPLQFPKACGRACYSETQYSCSNGQLAQAGSTTQPTSNPSSTSAPPTPSPSTQSPSTSTTKTPSTNAPSTSTSTRQPSTNAPSTNAPSTNAPSTSAPSTNAPSSTTARPSSGPTPLNGWCSSRTDCANIGQLCCETTHPATGVTESECYDPTKFTCGEKVMCMKPMLGCDYACYDPASLKCTNGQLGPK